MSRHDAIEPYNPPVRPQNERSSSQLEKATISHVETTTNRNKALDDAALVNGERTEKVIFPAVRVAKSV